MPGGVNSPVRAFKSAEAAERVLQLIWFMIISILLVSQMWFSPFSN